MHTLAQRPITDLYRCCLYVLTFKCLERLLLRRIKPLKPTLENTIVVELAGFRQGRSTGDQVLALTTFIENGFQLNQKKLELSF